MKKRKPDFNNDLFLFKEINPDQYHPVKKIKLSEEQKILLAKNGKIFMKQKPKIILSLKEPDINDIPITKEYRVVIDSNIKDKVLILGIYEIKTIH